MSRRKHLEQQMQEVPEMDENHSVARVVKLHGTNIVQVEAPGPGPSGELDALEECLCLLPAKFSKRFWVKRGNFVVIEFTVAKDHSSSNKIKGTITHILYPDQVKKLRKDDSFHWPEVFKEKPTATASENEPVGRGMGSDNDSYDSDGLPPLPPNPNKPKGYYTRRDSDSESSTTSD